LKKNFDVIGATYLENHVKVVWPLLISLKSLYMWLNVLAMAILGKSVKGKKSEEVETFKSKEGKLAYK